MAKYKEEKDSGKATSGSTSNGAAGYEYTPGDGSEAEQRDKMRGVEKSTSSGSTSGKGKNTSPTVSAATSAISAATGGGGGGGGGGYSPLGSYNDGAIKSIGAIDPITQYKAEYDAAKARGDTAGMEAAHQKAENYRAMFGYSGGADGSQNLGITEEQRAAAMAANYLGGGAGGIAGAAGLPTMTVNGAAMAYSADGAPYEIGSFLGKNFLLNGENGEVMTGGDGSKWTKGPDGMVYIEKNGVTYTVQGTPNEPIPEFSMPEFDGIEMYQATPFSYTPFENTELGQDAKKAYQKLLDQVNNFKSFEYDPETDPLYKQYADSYTRGGQRAMADVMGQLAARTGGMASSYAGTMAQQQYDQYMADLANKIPELQQLAYSMYMGDYNKLLGQYDRGYQRYADDYNRYMQKVATDQNTWATSNQLNQNSWATAAGIDAQQQQLAAQMSYNMYRDAIADRQWQTQMNQAAIQQNLENDRYAREWNYGLDQDVYNKAWKEKEWNYGVEQDTYNRQLAEQQLKLDTLSALYDRVDRYGYMPSQTDASMYGLTPEQLYDLQEQARHVRAADASKYYSGW